MDTNEQYPPLIPDGGRVYQTNYCSETPVLAIVRALSTLENCGYEEIPPLYRYIHPDAMNRLMETARDSDQEVTVEVTVEEYKISVDSDGTISVFDSENGSGPPE